MCAPRHTRSFSGGFPVCESGRSPHTLVRAPLSPEGASHAGTESRCYLQLACRSPAPPTLGFSWLGPKPACTVQLQCGPSLASLPPSPRKQPCLGGDAPLPTGDTIWGASPLLLPARSGDLRPFQPGGPLGHRHCCAVTWLCRTHCTLGTWRGCRSCSPRTAQLTWCWRARQPSRAGAATRGVRDSQGWESPRWGLGWSPQEQRRAPQD